VKLWQKISIANISVLLAVVVICSTVLIFHTKDNMLNFTTQQVQTEQRILSVSFSNMARYYLSDEANPLSNEQVLNIASDSLQTHLPFSLGSTQTMLFIQKQT